MANPTDPVGDEEILYRCVRDDRKRYAIATDGTLQVSSEAFLDVEYEPSVDRAALCHDGPKHTQREVTDGVASLLTSDIRAIREVGKSDTTGTLIHVYQVEIKPDPIVNHPTLGTNEAHAKIFTMPKCQHKKEFAKLRRSLARLASARGWVIKPAQLR